MVLLIMHECNMLINDNAFLLNAILMLYNIVIYYANHAIIIPNVYKQGCKSLCDTNELQMHI